MQRYSSINTSATSTLYFMVFLIPSVVRPSDFSYSTIYSFNAMLMAKSMFQAESFDKRRLFKISFFIKTIVKAV